MQITYKGDYALKAVLYLSSFYNTSVLPIHELAQKLDIPVKFLEQVLLELKKGGFVASKRGVKGGYYLVKHPKDITLGEVVRFVGGPIEPIACANTSKLYKGCNNVYDCVFRDIWIKVTKSVSDIIDNITFDDLCYKSNISKSLNYSI